MTEPWSLTVTSHVGMCNRLRVLLSGKVLAKETGRAFAMRWIPSPEAGCAFEQLFQNEWNVGADAAFDETHALDFMFTAWEAIPDVLTMTDAELSINYYAWLVLPERFPSHIPLWSRIPALLEELEPIPKLTRRIEQFRENVFRPVMIGVHLRRGDQTIQRPTLVKNLPLVMEQLDAWLDRKSEAGIFLCTDDGAPEPGSGNATAHGNVVAAMVKRYGSRVVYTTPSSLDRNTPQAIQDGLVDLWLLRATDFVIGTSGSSFSEFAVLGRNVPFVKVTARSLRYQRLVRRLKQYNLHHWHNVRRWLAPLAAKI